MSLSAADDHLGYFYLLAITNNAAINTHVQVFVCTDVLISLGCRPGSEVTLVYTVALCLTL